MKRLVKLLRTMIFIYFLLLNTSVNAQPPYMPKDLNGRITLQDAIYALQIASGIRSNIWFAPFDLAGDWFIGGSDLQGNHTWDGSVSINTAGIITGGIINSSEGPSYNISSGSFAITSIGMVTGSFLDSDGITTQFTMQMNSQKSIMVGDGNASGNEDDFFFYSKKNND